MQDKAWLYTVAHPAIGLPLTPRPNSDFEAILRVKWRHGNYGHDTIAILWA